MRQGFRRAMAWLHTWAGLVAGGLLFAVFWTGTLSVFHEEIDRWMMPTTRIVATTAPVSLDAVVVPLASELAAESSQWGVSLPSERRPFMPFFYRVAGGEFVVHAIDPRTGAMLPESGSEGASGFFVPFHYGLHLEWRQLGYWLVGIVSMAMLALLVSGVVIHRKRFREFFTFRPRRSLPRANLDLHNLTGMVALPFHAVITLSGLILFMGVYFPQAADLVYRGADEPRNAFVSDAYGSFRRPPSGGHGNLISLDALRERAQEHWSGSHARFVRVWHPGDAGSYVEIRRIYADQIALTRDQLFFDATTGEVLYEFTAAPVMSAQRFLSGLHFIDFDHWPLRWLYFVLGLSGCVMIATGYIHWLEMRCRRHALLGLPGVRIVEGLTVGSVTGILLATLAFFLANRLLPPGVHFADYERAALEVWAFYLAWLAAFVHAWLRPGRAWREQCRVIALLALLAVALNWITTGDHLPKTVAEGYWPVAGMDLLLLGSAVVAGYTARGRHRRRSVVAGHPPGRTSTRQHG